MLVEDNGVFCAFRNFILKLKCGDCGHGGCTLDYAGLLGMVYLCPGFPSLERQEQDILII